MIEFVFRSLVLGVALSLVPAWGFAADPTDDADLPEPVAASEITPGSVSQVLEEGDDAPAPEQTQELRSRKARDGSGYGGGPGGERGQGSEGAPHHRQYGKPPGSADD